MIKEGYPHHPHSLNDPFIVDFMLQSVQETNSIPPAFVGNKYFKTSFYSSENVYNYNAGEDAYVTYRGPQFTPCYDRYQFGIENIPGGSATVIHPQGPCRRKSLGVSCGFYGKECDGGSGLAGQGFLHRYRPGSV